jgi:hypothetical protein
MKIDKTVTGKMLAANRANASKSTGPRTGAGKTHARMNAHKHGFFAKELQLSEEDRPEFEFLRDSLSQQFAPATPMQRIALDKIVCCAWRCKIALRIEALAVALQRSSKQEPKVDAARGGDTFRMEQWYAADYRSLQDGLRFLRALRADVADNGLLHLEQEGSLKESLIKGFGSNFYKRLIEWKGMSTTAILSAEHLARMQEKFNLPTTNLPSIPETPKVIADPRLLWQMVVKLVDVEIEHLEILVRTRGQDFRETPLALAESSPRYYADASRDLHRAVDWFLKLKRVIGEPSKERKNLHQALSHVGTLGREHVGCFFQSQGAEQARDQPEPEVEGSIVRETSARARNCSFPNPCRRYH